MRELGVMGEVDAANGSSEGLTLPLDDLVEDLRDEERRSAVLL